MIPTVIPEMVLAQWHQAVHRAENAVKAFDAAAAALAEAKRQLVLHENAVAFVKASGVDLGPVVKVLRAANLPKDKQPCAHWDEVCK